MNVNPTWQDFLVGETFHATCEIHQNESSNKHKNFFCVNCCRGICKHCIDKSQNHQNHVHFQVRVNGRDIVLLQDLQKVADCSDIQPYVYQEGQAIYLRPSGKSRSTKKIDINIVICTCGKIMNEEFKYSDVTNKYCSLLCKLRGERGDTAGAVVL